MAGQFEIPFEELPLIVDLGFEAGLVNGTATIRYENDGEWSVTEITLDGYKDATEEDKARALARKAPVPLVNRRSVVIGRDDYPWLYSTIYDRLENSRFKSTISDRIADELATDGIAHKPDWRAHSTLNRAQQGV